MTEPKGHMDYVSAYGAEFDEKKTAVFRRVKILPQLNGRPWDEKALALVQAARPSHLFVIKDFESTVFFLWAVYVYVDEQEDGTLIIKKIEQSSRVGWVEGVDELLKGE